MITISKYEEKNGVVEMSLFISNPYSGNSQTRHETFTTAEQAQNHYWQLVYSYFNYGIEQFVEHCKSIAGHYQAKTMITELITLSNGVIKDLEKKNETINKTNLKTA